MKQRRWRSVRERGERGNRPDREKPRDGSQGKARRTAEGEKPQKEAAPRGRVAANTWTTARPSI